VEYIDKDNNNNKDNNNEKGISALRLDEDLGFSRGHQGQQPHDDDDEEEDKDKVEDNNKSDDNNNKEDTDDKSISALGLDRDLRFLRGHQGHWPHDGGDEEEDNDKGDTNNKDGSNNMYENDDKSISSLGQDRDMWFSLCLCSKKIWKKGRKIHNC
jgi:hypothetical protein